MFYVIIAVAVIAFAYMHISQIKASEANIIAKIDEYVAIIKADASIAEAKIKTVIDDVKTKL